MRLSKFFFFFFTALVSSAALGAEGKDQTKKATNESMLPSGSRIVLLGDSLAQGMASPFLTITKKCGYKGMVYATHSTTIDYWSKRIERIMSDTRPSLVLISLGTNDSGILRPELQRPHIKKIVGTVKKYNSKILWIVPRKLPQKFRSQDAIRKMIAEETNSYSVQVEIQMSKDQIHPTQQGYGEWIKSVWIHLSDNSGLLVRLPGVEPGNGAL